MEKIDYQLKVMKAHKEGKKIECIDTRDPEDNWKETVDPIWNWGDFDYRVKEEPNYRPYENKEEFMLFQKQHGIYLYKLSTKEYFIPTSVINGGVEFTQLGESVSYGWEMLIEEFIWQDGTPCGVKA